MKSDMQAPIQPLATQEDKQPLNNELMPNTSDETGLPPLTGIADNLSLDDISKVMNPERLATLLAQAAAFSLVNSEDLDDF